MEYKWEYDFKSIALFLFLILLPNLLGIINISLLGLKIHFFQIAIILAALYFGPIGGLSAGLIGSIYPAFLVSNPYIIVGNAILGFFIGYFYKGNIYSAVMTAFLIQIPWIIATDLIIGLSFSFILQIIIALFISNMIWAFIAKRIYKNA